MGSTPSRTSSLVRAIDPMPLRATVYRETTASNQPTRRARPVVVPYSRPTSRIRSPVASSSSVGIGPYPTRVVKALYTPRVRSTRVGGIPDPVSAPPADGEDDVTYG